LYAHKSALQSTIVDFLLFWAYISGMDTPSSLGRPIKGGESRSARMSMRAEPAAKERYERAAAKAGMSLTDWVKTQLDKAAHRALGD